MTAISTLLLAAALGASPQASPPTIEQVRASVQRSIPFIEEKGVWWIENKKCVSCHRVAMMTWSLSAAKRRGFSVSARLEEWIDWSLEKSASENDKGKIVGAGNKDGLAQLLLARDGVNVSPKREEAYRQFVQLIVEGQEANGSWNPDGQLPSQNRAKSETTAVSTAWNSLALSYTDAGAAHQEVLKKAAKVVQASAPGKSTEWYVARLLLAKAQGDEASASGLINDLREQQNDDGGWGWLVGGKSDALGTGMSLYALSRVGVSPADAAIWRAQRFLLDEQRDDGSWAVFGTKANKKDSVQETAVYWGAAWAALGLLETLPH